MKSEERKYANISQASDRDKLRFQMRINGHQVNFGYFETLEEALNARATVYSYLKIPDPDNINPDWDAIGDSLDYLLDKAEKYKLFVPPLAQTEKSPRQQRRTKAEIQLAEQVAELKAQVDDLERRHAALADMVQRANWDAVTTDDIPMTPSSLLNLGNN